MIVESWLARAARAHPDRMAVECPDGSRTYAELHQNARVCARAFSQHGIGTGDRVAIALPAGPEFAEVFHACLLLGAVAVPVDMRFGADERAAVCARAACVVDEPLEAGAAVEDGGSVEAGAAVKAGGSSEAGAEIDADGAAGGHDLDAVAAIIHTSGTTSAPRPIELTYGNFLWSALGSAVALDLDPRERWLCALPLSHVGGLSILVRSAIYATTAIVHPRWDTELVLRALRAGDEEGDRGAGVTLVSLVATTLARLLDAGLRDPPALRHALTGGGPVPDALIARAAAAGVPVSTTYGLTEACSQVTTGGPPLFCTRVRIDGVARGAEAEGEGEGEGEGEILVAGPTVARASLAPDGWLHTGDVGSLDERGHLQVTGRAADTIVSGGENVAPAEVEAVLEAHPSVLEAAVLGRPDPTWGEAVTAIVVLRADVRDGQTDAELEETLGAHCRGSLARYKVPKHIELSETPLPRTRSGKLLRRELRMGREMQ